MRLEPVALFLRELACRVVLYKPTLGLEEPAEQMVILKILFFNLPPVLFVELAQEVSGQQSVGVLVVQAHSSVASGIALFTQSAHSGPASISI
jgi:hypothetical protein